MADLVREAARQRQLEIKMFTRPQANRHAAAINRLCDNEVVDTLNAQPHFRLAVVDNIPNDEQYAGVVLFGRMPAGDNNNIPLPYMDASQQFMQKLVAFKPQNTQQILQLNRPGGWSEIAYLCARTDIARELLFAFALASLSSNNPQAPTALSVRLHTDHSRLLEDYGFHPAIPMRRSRVAGVVDIVPYRAADAGMRGFRNRNRVFVRVANNQQFITPARIRRAFPRIQPPAPVQQRRGQQQQPARRPRRQRPARRVQQYPVRMCGQNPGNLTPDELKARVYTCFRRGFATGYNQGLLNA